MPTCNVLNRLKAARKILKQNFELRYFAGGGIKSVPGGRKSYQCCSDFSADGAAKYFLKD